MRFHESQRESTNSNRIKSVWSSSVKSLCSDRQFFEDGTHFMYLRIIFVQDFVVCTRSYFVVNMQQNTLSSQDTKRQVPKTTPSLLSDVMYMVRCGVVTRVCYSLRTGRKTLVEKMGHFLDKDKLQIYMLVGVHFLTTL
jgi:hypothetical protein